MTLHCSVNNKLDDINEHFNVVYSDSCMCPSLHKVLNDNNYISFIQNVERVVGNNSFFLVKSKFEDDFVYHKFENGRNYYKDEILREPVSEYNQLIKSSIITFKYDYQEYYE